MNNKLLSLAETVDLIKAGHTLVISAHDKLLDKLPQGNWVGGSIPYFYFENQLGRKDTEHLLVKDFTSEISNFKILTYEEHELYYFANKGFDNGFHFLVLPALTSIHLTFALEAPIYESLYENPLTGLIAGADLDEFAKHKLSKVYNGLNKMAYVDKAVMLHTQLPPNRKARVELVNCFTPSQQTTIRVPEDTFTVSDCVINNQEDNLFDFFERINYDTRFPITCDYGDKIVNVGIQYLDAEKREVVLYGPMFEGFDYNLSKPIKNYPQFFKERMQKLKQDESNMVYNCNCIQNYLDGKLEEQSVGFTGAASFGEIAYQLVNQSFTYLAIDNI